MPETTVCAYCASVIPAGTKTCPMCGADNQPDYLQEIVAPPPVVKPAPAPIPPQEPAILNEPVRETPAWETPAPEPLPDLERTSPTTSSPTRYLWILFGVVAAVIVCLCIAAVLIANLVLGV